MHILNLGAGGFIGAHLTQRLLAEGHTVVGVDTHTDKITEFQDDGNFTFIKQDITRPDVEMSSLVKDADLVVDMIAYSNPGMYVRKPLDVFYLNFNQNLKIAENCVKYGKRLIQFSSSEVYGKTAGNALPDKVIDPADPALATFSEDRTDFILGPVNKHRWIYACAKQLLERVLHAYGLEGRLNYTIIRPFNNIGPKIDYLPSDTDGVPRVFSYFMEALIKGTRMELVNGGSNRRCYTYIEDAIDCVYRIVLNRGGVCDRQIFNIGSPENEISIRELAEMMRTIYAEKFRPGAPLPEIVPVTAEEFYGEGYEDSDRRIPDITKARTLLGWEPCWSLPDMLEVSMKYYLEEYETAVLEWRQSQGNKV